MLDLTATLTVLQQSVRCRWQFAVEVSEKYHVLYETEQLSLDHLHAETACVNLFDEPLQSLDFLEYVQLLAASERECYSWTTEPQSAVYQQTRS
ncbi:hypothetical protein CKA32_000736 [Geitlerinema sp. FC II]|nr:hypothetical protein CKA32_000736 [Geitlerinema sp. FC II]